MENQAKKELLKFRLEIQQAANDRDKADGVGTKEYTGKSYFWNYEYRHHMRDSSRRSWIRAHAALLKAGLNPSGFSSDHTRIILKYTDNMYGKKVKFTREEIENQISAWLVD